MNKASNFIYFRGWVFVGAICFLFSATNSIAVESDQVTRLRTLFTTPLERKKLDDLRNSGQYDKQRQKEDGQAVIREPLKIEVKGVVFRDNQKPVVWVNDGNTLKSQKIENGINVRTAGIKKEKVKIPVKAFQKTLSMKPGQQWTETDGKIQDKYQIKPLKNKTSDAEAGLEFADNENVPK